MEAVRQLLREAINLGATHAQQNLPRSSGEPATVPPLTEPPVGLVATMRELLAVYTPLEVVQAIGKVKGEA